SCLSYFLKLSIHEEMFVQTEILIHYIKSIYFRRTINPLLENICGFNKLFHFIIRLHIFHIDLNILFFPQ
ncbi:hypothetical protein L9F63_006319, partial [Diploptera punctata]